MPHPPGGPGDVPPRGIAQALSQSMVQPFTSAWPTGAPSEGFEKFIRSEVEEFGKLAKIVGLKPQ